VERQAHDEAADAFALDKGSQIAREHGGVPWIERAPRVGEQAKLVVHGDADAGAARIEAAHTAALARRHGRLLARRMGVRHRRGLDRCRREGP
jgi:hypothetical protein